MRETYLAILPSCDKKDLELMINQDREHFEFYPLLAEMAEKELNKRL